MGASFAAPDSAVLADFAIEARTDAVSKDIGGIASFAVAADGKEEDASRARRAIESSGSERELRDPKEFSALDCS
jgi:hypothetical protein